MPADTRRAQLEELTLGPADVEGSVVLLGLRTDLGTSKSILRSAGFQPAGTPALAWTRGPLPQPSVQALPFSAIGQFFTLAR